MKRISVSGVFVFALMAHASCNAETPLPGEIFSLGGIKIGVSTLRDVQALLGKSSVTRSGKEDESPLEVCYEAPSSGEHFYIVFESGAMGGFSRVTDFVITKQRPAGECSRLTSVKSVASSGNGVQLGQSREEFLSKFPTRFAANGNDLSYQLQTTRPADTEELKNLKKEWPNEKSYKFDVVIDIQAHFDNGVLTRYQVSKIESF